MARGLDHVKRDLVLAYQSRDPEKLRKVIDEYNTRKASAERSQANAQQGYGSNANADGNFAAGYGRGSAHVLGRLTQAALPKSMESAAQKRFPTLTITDEERDSRKATDADLLATTSGKVGSFLGETAAAAPVAGVGGAAARTGLLAAARTIAPAGRAAQLASGALPAGTKLPKFARYGGWGAEGAAGQAATTGEVTPGGVAVGALGGRLGDALGALGSASVRGIKRGAHADELLEKGADLTPGQLRPGSLWDSMERTAAVAPGTGAGVRTARESATAPVVPNLIADIQGTARVPGQTTREATRGYRTNINQLYGPDAPRKVKPFEVQSFATTIRRSMDRHMPAGRRDAPQLDPRKVTLRNLRNPPTPASHREVYAELQGKMDRLAGANTQQEVKAILSDLRATSRLLKGAKESKGAGRMEAVRVYDDAIKWLDDFYKAGFQPAQRATVTEADTIVSQMKPILSAARSAAKDNRASPSGRELLTALAKNEPTEGFVAGTRTGPTRRVAESLAEVENLPSAGGVERHPWARTLLGWGLAAPTAIASSGLGRRVAQGATSGQRIAQKVADTRGADATATLIDILRRGVPGASMDELDEVQY